MAVWAVGDLHLSFGTPGKTMDRFGPEWVDHAEKIAKEWKNLVKPDDLVLIPGDISWAMRLEQALIDLQWIDALPGSKIILRGNHDYWWPSLTKLIATLPPSIKAIHNSALISHGWVFGGTRLWDSPEYSFNPYINFKGTLPTGPEESEADMASFFAREIKRLKLSLDEMDRLDPKRTMPRCVMTHYPPIGADLKESAASRLFEEYGVNVVVFGHLHSLFPGKLTFGEARGVKYMLTSCDAINFTPVPITL